MKKHLASLEFQKELVALLLSVVLLATTYSVMGETDAKVLLFGLMGMLIQIPLFFFLTFVRRVGIIGGIICTVVYLGLFYGLMALSVAGYSESGVGFIQWLVTKADEVESAQIYALLLLVGGSIFYGTVTYYFTVVRYRVAILTLVSLVPCVVYAKAIADVDNKYLVMIAALNIFIAVLEARGEDLIPTPKPKEKKKFFAKPDIKEHFSDKMSLGSLITALVFVAVIMVAGALIPKKEEAKYYDLFEDTFLGGDTTSDVSGIASDLMDISGNADGYIGDSNRRLYSVYGDQIVYLKRQRFDVYSFENDYWTPLAEYSDWKYEPYEWTNTSDRKNLSKLQGALITARNLAPKLSEKYDIAWLDNMGDLYDWTGNITINSLNFSAAYLLAPEGMIDIHPEDGAEQDIIWDGTVYRKEGKAPENYEYTVSYQGYNTVKIDWCLLGGANMDDEQMTALLTSALQILRIELGDQFLASEWEYAKDRLDITQLDLTYAVNLISLADVLSEYIKEIEIAKAYNEATKFNTVDISEDIVELAEEITKDCKYDYEKAIALSSYFSDTNFVYDIGYRAPDKSTEYFLFTSKRGTCSDFATAYTLMARSVGLTVRYMEGYVTENSGRPGLYYIKEGNSHAYPETFIAGVGWTVFEPTKGLIDDSEQGFFASLFSNMHVDIRLVITIAIAVGIVAAIIVIVRIIIPLIIEGIFSLRILWGLVAIKKVYQKLLANVLHRKLHRKYRKIATIDKSILGYTPEELKKLYAKYGIDISAITNMVEKLAYMDEQGNIDIKRYLKTQSSAIRRLICKQYNKANTIFRH